MGFSLSETLAVTENNSFPKTDDVVQDLWQVSAGRWLV